MENNSENILNKTLIRLGEVVQLEDNLETASKGEISRNSFGRRIKVKLMDDAQDLEVNDLPWVWPLLPKHLQIMPKIGEMVMVFYQSIDSPNGNRFYIGPIISQDYYLNHGGKYEALSLMQGISTKPICHPRGNTENDGTYPDSDVIAIQGRGDAAMWLKDEELRLMCGHKPSWNIKPTVEGADPGSLVFNRKNLGYIQMKFDKFLDKKGREFNSVINVVADKINLISHDGADCINLPVTDQQELITKERVEQLSTKAESMVYGDQLINFLEKFRRIFAEHTHHWLYDLQVVCEKDADFWNKDLNELLCKSIKVV